MPLAIIVLIYQVIIKTLIVLTEADFACYCSYSYVCHSLVPTYIDTSTTE